MKWHRTLASLAGSLSLVAVATAQQEQGENRERDMEAKERASSKAKPFVLRSGDVIGTSVETMKGDEIGEVEDLLIDSTSGKIPYALVGTGGFLGMGENVTVIPCSELQPRQDGDSEECTFRIDTTKETLESAPEFPEDRWPNLDATWAQRVHQHFGAEQPADDERAGRPVFVRLSDLKGAEVHGSPKGMMATDGRQQQDEDEQGMRKGDSPRTIGHINEVVIDPNEKRLNYVVLEVDELEKLPDNEVVVPWELFQSRYEDEKLFVSASRLSSDQLARAPTFEEGEWDSMSNPIWVREVYSFWQLDPYWSRAMEAGYQKPEMKKGMDEKKETEGYRR